MDDDDADVGDSLGEFVRQLSAELRWDPATNTKGADKRAFVEALTEIAALPLDSISMEVRRLLVTFDERGDANEEAKESDEAPVPTHLRHIVVALESRDVLLKCKAANAIGSLCISRVAGQHLLDVVGAHVLASLTKMAICKNQWAQGDALFVLGWVVVVADEAMLASISALVPSVLKFFRRNLKLLLSTRAPMDQKTSALVSSEQATNFRVYSLVLLLNLCQRDASVFGTQVDTLSEVLGDVLQVLLMCHPEEGNEDSDRQTTSLDASEFAELLRLTVTILSLLVSALDGMRDRMLELKMVPLLLKLKRMVDDSEESASTSDPEEADDVAERLKALVSAVLSTS